MKRFPSYILILFVLFTACNSGARTEQEDDATVISLNLSSPQKELALSEFIDSISTIRLTLPDSLFFGQVSSILTDKENIYAKDSKQHVMFRFNKDGEFLNTIGRRGGGPGEYPNIGRTFLGDNCVYIDHLASRHIYSYAPDGEFIHSFSIPFSIVYDDILALPDGYFLCYKSGEPEKGLWTMNDKGEIVDTVLTETEVYPQIHSPMPELTVDAQQMIHVCNSSKGELYTYNPFKKEVRKAYKFQPDVKLLGGFKGEDSSFGIKEERASCDMVIESEQYLFTLWSIFADKPQGRFVYALFDKQTGKATTYTRIKQDIPEIFSLGMGLASNIPNAWVIYFPDEFTKDKYPDKYKELGMKENVLIVKVMHLK